MGLIQAGLSAVNSVLADQWKEYFYCEALDTETLVVKGRKKNTGKSNKGNDNIISNGSVVAVADGQCMIIVDNGKIAELCAEPGEFRYDASSEPSVFAGDLGSAVKETFKVLGKRFTFGATSPSAASASTPTASPTPSCSTPTSAATCRTPTPAASSTTSSRPSC